MTDILVPKTREEWLALRYPVDPTRDRYVYALFLGTNPTPRYIGIGKRYRLTEHAARARRGDIHQGSLRKGRILAYCVRRSIPIIAAKLVTNLTIPEAMDIERHLIKHYGRRDLRTGCLLNVREGGFGVKNLAPSTLAKRSEMARGNKYRLGIPHSEETRAKLRHARSLWGPVTDKQRAQIAEMNRKKALDPGYRARLSAALKGRSKSAEARAKMSAAKIGKPGPKASDEARANMRAAQKGKTVSEATRAKLSIANRKPKPRVKQYSAETLKRMSEGQTRRYAKIRSGGL